MTLVTITSASGSPGASTTALGMAMTWGSPCLYLEADPTGSSYLGAGYYRGEAMPTERTVADLAIPAREGVLAETLPMYLARLGESETFILPSAHGHTQAGGLSSDIWAQIATTLTSSTNAVDTIADIGRLGLAGSPRPLLTAADMVLLVLRSDLPGIIGAQSWARSLRDARAGLTETLGLVLITPGHRARRGIPHHSAREISTVLGLPVVATIPDLPDEAAVFSHGTTSPRRRAELREAYTALGHRTRAARSRAVSAAAGAR